MQEAGRESARSAKRFLLHCAWQKKHTDPEPFSIARSSYPVRRLGRGAMAPTIGDTVVQVVTHSVNHRRRVNTRLRELGCEPPLTEYTVWVWRGKPTAD